MHLINCHAVHLLQRLQYDNIICKSLSLSSIACFHSPKARMPRKLLLSKRPKNFKIKRTAEIRSNLECILSIPAEIAGQNNTLKRQVQNHGTLPHGSYLLYTVPASSDISYNYIIIGWILNESCTEYVQLYYIKDDRIYYNLKVKKNYSWLLHLCGQKVWYFYYYSIAN